MPSSFRSESFSRRPISISEPPALARYAFSSAGSGRPGLEVTWLGEVEYATALELQLRTLDAMRHHECGDQLLLLTHPPVLTLGRRSRAEHLLEDRRALAKRGIEVIEVSRGGDVTYHGPGQIVGYLQIDLRARGSLDLHRFLRDVEAALIEVLVRFGVPAERREGTTGVFIESEEARPRKIASIGIGVRHWITYHGFALNVDPDLGSFDAIVPCGLPEVEMTSLARELGTAETDLEERVRSQLAEVFARRFG